MDKKILGLDLGSNSIGWALIRESNGKPSGIVDLGSRIFIKAVEEKTPTPKNQKRRSARLARRVIKRRARRKQRLLNYLVSLDLLPKELQGHNQPEFVLNQLGDPYALRAIALDQTLEKYQLGRVLLHLVQRRGFLSNRKTLLGDMVDDPDVQSVLSELEDKDDNSTERAKEETAFKKDISELRQAISDARCRTMGEYLATFGPHDVKRNRAREGGHLRTDRQMYRDELELIWQRQQLGHHELTEDVKEQLEEIIFYQRPLKLRSDRIGKCSLEPRRKRANIARLESQRFRYLQDINNLQFFDHYSEEWRTLSDDDRSKLVSLFEITPTPTFAKIKMTLGLDRKTEFNLELGTKKLKGNITACEIRSVLNNWDELDCAQQLALVEDLLTIQKKSILKKRLVQYWGFEPRVAVKLCLLEFEPGHGNHSIKAINALLPYLEKGQIYSDARISAGYGYEEQSVKQTDRLGPPPEITNPIVQKGLYEIRRVVNAIIAEYGKPDAIRIEMARDLEMNTKRYKAFIKQQKANTTANEEAVQKYKEIGQKNPHLLLSKYPSRSDKIRYRLWKDQDGRCAYSGKAINLSTLFSSDIDVDHILPYSQSLDDSYMNKVVCFAGENRYKGQRTPVDAYGSRSEKWNQITQALKHWDKKLSSKAKRFYKLSSELHERDFIGSQLTDTRYMSKVTQSYLAVLGADITVSKGVTTAWLRHQWGLNSLIGETNKKERTDHRHHAIDALVIACVDRKLYQDMVDISKELERSQPELKMKDIHIDPPWEDLRRELEKQLAETIVSHCPQRKLNGALHEETGVGYIEGVGTVYRVTLDGNFKTGQVKKIVDDDVREIIQRHMNRYDNKPKNAFAEGVTVFHKDGKTPIKRVRVVQSATSIQKLENSKYGVKGSNGKVFKWLAYGNLHHVEILKSKKTGKYHGVFVTMMEAHRRAMTGAKSAIKRGVTQEQTIQLNHGTDWEFVTALHINDSVSVQKNGQREFYRVQKLEQPGRVTLRVHFASTLVNEGEMIRKSIGALMRGYELKKHGINAIGKVIG